jgi:hypothetical protein
MPEKIGPPKNGGILWHMVDAEPRIDPAKKTNTCGVEKIAIHTFDESVPYLGGTYCGQTVRASCHFDVVEQTFHLAKEKQVEKFLQMEIDVQRNRTVH